MLSRCLVSQVKHNSYFLIGVAIGLWLAMSVVPVEEPEPCVETTGGGAGAVDEFEPVLEQRPPGAAAAGRSVTRPRYYTTELGMRAPLLAGVLSSEAELDGRVAALNRTAGRLQPALRFFMGARSLAAPGPARPNVVGFTDAREMLKPFHALKYLADNYLDDYDFFFLVSDASFVNARRLADLAAKLSASQHVYMGAAVGDSGACSLSGGVLLSASVLRAAHAQLDWCVRNSYSPHHHENLARCVLHAMQLRCMSEAQGEKYVSVDLPEAGLSAESLTPALADAVTVRAVTKPQDMYTLHAYVSRIYLERGLVALSRARSYLRRNVARHPPHFRNVTWPAGLRDEPGSAETRPDSRWDHLRWTSFNATHAYMLDDHRAVAPLTGAYKDAVDLVVSHAGAWAERAWGAGEARAALVEGAWRFEPARQLRYRLLMRLTSDKGDQMSRWLEVSRPLGAARLVAVPYVTESARVWLLLPATRGRGEAWLRRDPPANTALTVVLVHEDGTDASTFAAVRAAATAAGAAVAEARVTSPGATEAQRFAAASAAALAVAALPKDALVLIADPDMDYNEDFLNRVRMNTIAGVSWSLPAPLARYSAPLADKPARSARFNTHHTHVLSFYKKDYDAALLAWASSGGPPSAPPAAVLAPHLRCVRAAEPALVLRAHTCRSGDCVRALRDRGFREVDLAANTDLARLVLQRAAEAD